MTDKNTSSSKILYPTVTVAICLAFIVFRILNFLNTENIVVWFDSAVYAAVSAESIWSPAFWLERQPPLYPLLFKMFVYTPGGQELVWKGLVNAVAFHPEIIKGLKIADDPPFLFVVTYFDVISLAILQSIISIFAWIMFSLSFGRLFSDRRIRILAILLVLILGSETGMTLWDKHILTESISISLSLVLLALLFHYKNVMESMPFFVLFLLTLALFSFVRITNNYFLLLLVPFIAVQEWQFRHKYAVKSAVIFSVLLSLIIFNQYAVFKGNRAEAPLKSLVSSRISTEGFEDIYRYFRDSGMPEIPDSFRGKYWYAPYKDYPEIEQWLAKAPEVYQHYLLTHPAYFLFQPFKTTNSLNIPVYSILTPDLAFHEITEKRNLAFIFTDVFLGGAFIALIILALMNARLVNTVKNELLLPLYLLPASLAMLMVIWHGDLVEINRHAIQFAIILRIGLISALLVLVDRIILNPGRERGNTATCGDRLINHS